MSIRIMGYCWDAQLTPSQKAVLMSLADQANDHGVCWPSISSIARRTCLSRRTVIRAVADLESMNILTCEQESGKSNRYTIHPPHPSTPSNGSDPCHGDTSDTVSPASLCPPTSDTVSREGCHSVTQTVKNRNRTVTTTDAAAETAAAELIVPAKLTPKERVVVVDLITGVAPELQQDVLDELAGALHQKDLIRRSPVNYFRGLVRKAMKGEFRPSLGIVVAAQRDRDKKHRQEQLEARKKRKERGRRAHSPESQRAAKRAKAQIEAMLGHAPPELTSSKNASNSMDGSP